MKCKTRKCNKEGEYRFELEWWCWKCYLIKSSNEEYKSLRLSERDKSGRDIQIK